MAPEVIEKKYGKQADLWSLGVLLYQLLSGYMPFTALDQDELYRKIKNCEWKFVEPEFNEVSPECKDLINLLL